MNINLKIEIMKKFGTQYDFAAKLGVNESLVSKVIRGRRVLNGTEQERWAAVLEKEAKEVFDAERD